MGNSGSVEDGFATMQALSHYSYHATDGRCLVCDLQGVFDGEQYILTDPVICSTAEKFGVTDLGQKGIQNFFAYHECNSICHRWKTPTSTAMWYRPVSGTT